MSNDNKKPSKVEKDKFTGVETTGHEWDGIKELNNPSPRWWLWVFLLTFIWSVGYWIVYPAWPTTDGHTKGSYGWSQYTQLKEQQGVIFERKAKYLKALKNKELNEISTDPELYKFAVAGGNIVFKENCASCHGIDASGQGRYPNLNDDDWLWGGSLEDIYATIKYGIRSTHDDTRVSAMTAFGSENVLSRSEISDVVDHVLSLSGKAKANEKGHEIYKNNCTSCHGDNGRGDLSIGAPDLADAIWLYGGDKDAVAHSVYYARNGVMPHWESRLSDEKIKQLSIFVHSLGGGE